MKETISIATSVGGNPDTPAIVQGQMEVIVEAIFYRDLPEVNVLALT